MHTPPRAHSTLPQTGRALAGLLLLSGVTHLAQLAVYQHEANVLGAAGFGAVYFMIGIAILGRWPAALHLAVVLPTIGGLLGVYRFLFLHTNPFSVWHVVLDLIIVPLAVRLLARPRTEPPGTPSGAPASP
ncbi:hypothetical protein [Streptomyces sp. DH8]|uniref:hypothetical protein n=1 Tax=Streptomyces sp. DH8 TaxID=2857008 RepID=UPI001E4C8271|nr:hypothetical protein [Streptomyces sp. DH8]